MPIERFMVPGELEPVSHYCHAVKAETSSISRAWSG